MQGAMIEEVTDQIIELIGVKEKIFCLPPGETGIGIEEILEAIVTVFPLPKANNEAPLQALIFDSVFNSFRGIIAYFRVFNGSINKGANIRFFNSGEEYFADEVGILKLWTRSRAGTRSPWDVGYIITGINNAKEVKSRGYHHPSQ